ncbi:hypothetical protein SAMN02745207_00793 [Clostridium grantii DSM 8605]|uniref:Major facilitator superfamily (MFS) profile domain-containing protein n=1 Tax=Clostridium grantii DSM 8605 TaxID=1121316 RepID=A0A1M5S6Z5_9CLOT|nr:hypothetical protein SAMN02745207_00793 [Clostridium grantii DSM 8605]
MLHKGINAEIAATWASLFYLGITLGRFVSGFIAALGTLLLLIPLGDIITLMGLILVGLGCAPIFPSLLHETPNNFGSDKSQAIMGMQMACAYLGTTFMSPVFGFIAEYISLSYFFLTVVKVCTGHIVHQVLGAYKIPRINPTIVDENIIEYILYPK